MDFAYDFVVDDPLTFDYFLEGSFAANIFRFGIHAWIFIAEFGVLEISRVDFTEFGVLEFFWDRQNSPFLLIGLAQICRSCYF